MKISIVIPAHNEEKRIGKTLKEYFSFFSKLKKKKILDYEIIVVLNACKDNTKKVVKKYKIKELKILDFEQGGKGFAITQGFKHALGSKSDLIGFVDADLATPAKSFYDLVNNIKENGGAIASRWRKNSVIITKQSFLRKITSKGFNYVVRVLFLFPYRDTQCGAKIFKREALGKIIKDLGTTGWAFDIDLIYKVRKNKYKIKEHPTVWEDKKDSKLDLKIAPILMFLSVLRLRLLNSPFKGFMRIYDKLPEWIKIHHKLK